MNIIPIKEINRAVEDDPVALICESEQHYAEQINTVAKDILKHRREKPILLLSGPSGSGKTTSALRIEALLRSWGCDAMTLSMDNYYLPADATPQAMNEQGEVDYESPYRLDIPLLSDHLTRLAQCEEIQLPVFNFAKQCREQGPVLRRRPGSLLILEGIHALNPEVTGAAGEFASCIYVSVRTRLKKADGALLHPSKIRLMRRLIRDKLYRGRCLGDTLTLFHSVSRGEDLYIMPHKHRATYEIDTLLGYEASVYQPILCAELRELAKFYPDFNEYADLLAFLEELSPLPAENVPDRSLVREFIGGSTFLY